MHEKVETAPFGAQGLEHGVDTGNVLDIARQHGVDLELIRKRLDALAQRFALIGEGKLGALGPEGLGNTPGDGVIIGNAHDQTAFSLHQACHCRPFSASCGGLVPGIHDSLSVVSKRGWPGQARP